MKYNRAFLRPGGLSDRHLSLVLLLTTSLIWGTSFILIKKAVRVLGPLETGSLRISFAFLLFLPVVALQLRRIPRRLTGWVVVSGLIGSLFPSLLFSWAGSRISSSLSGMLNAVTPLFTVLIGALFLGERYPAMRWAGLLTGMAGAAGLALSRGNDRPDWNMQVIPVVVATLLYALNVNLIRRKLSGIPPLLLSGATVVAAGPPAMAILLGATDFTGHIRQGGEVWQAAGYVAVLGFFGTAFALVLFNKLIQLSGTLTASSVTYIMPVISLAWGLGDGEPIGALQVAGLAGILTGVYLVNRKPEEEVK